MHEHAAWAVWLFIIGDAILCTGTCCVAPVLKWPTWVCFLLGWIISQGLLALYLHT